MNAISTLLRNRSFLGWLQQAALLLAVLALLGFLAHNAFTNLEQRGVTSGFGFLNETASFDINFSLLAYSPSDTHWDAYLVGLTNTLFVSLLSVITVTLLGLAVALARLSSNGLLSRLAYAYVEYFRNVPVVVHLMMWYGIVLSLPALRERVWVLQDSILISNRGIYFPEPSLNSLSLGFAITLIATLILTSYLKPGPLAERSWLRWACALLLPVLFCTLLGAPLDFTPARITGFNAQGGLNLQPELLALWLATTVYFATHASEAIRSGILAVNKGQREAAYALGVSPGTTMMKIILPQAMIIIVPIMTNIYINVLKNSTLGIAVGYMDLMATTGGTTLNQTGQAVECIVMVMATFSLLNLLTSLAMNIYNRKVALVER